MCVSVYHTLLYRIPYLALQQPPRVPSRPLGFVCWSALAEADKELAEVEASTRLEDPYADGDTEDEEAEGEGERETGEKGEVSDSGDADRGAGVAARGTGGRGRGRGGVRGAKRPRGRGGGYIGEIIDGPRRRKVPNRDGYNEEDDEGDGREAGAMSPCKRDGLRIDGAKRRWRAPDEKKEREAKKRIISALTKGQKVWVFNSKEQWPLNSVSIFSRALFLRRRVFCVLLLLHRVCTLAAHGP
jgi:hypothetical protein